MGSRVKGFFLTSTILLTAFISPAAAAADVAAGALDLTATGYGVAALVLFVIAYAFVVSEEFLHLRKSKPVVVAAGLIWLLVGLAYQQHGGTAYAGEQLRHNILEYGELLLFMLAAMTYVNTLQERNLFEALRARLISSGYSLRRIYWLTGIFAFFISAVADNLTTALIFAAVVMTVGGDDKKFITVSCINVVVAANAGGAFSPFGDITTLMVWQAGLVSFFQFFALFIPSLVNWFVPALLMSLAVPRGHPGALREHVSVKRGTFIVVGLFALTIAMAVAFHHFLHFPPVLGMMTGLGLLQLYGYVLRRHELKSNGTAWPEQTALDPDLIERHYKPRHRPFDIYISMKRAEWDTLMFFYGVILCVGGLGALGYLAYASQHMYTALGPTMSNVLVGLLSAVVDNIPVMFAVITMEPQMPLGQWLLVTLTAGVGGSLLSIGSAAGVAVMGQARGIYTFFSHLRWTWAIALGYAASIWVHLWLNAELMR